MQGVEPLGTFHLHGEFVRSRDDYVVNIVVVPESFQCIYITISNSCLSDTIFKIFKSFFMFHIDIYRIRFNTTPGFYFSKWIFDPRLPHKKHIKKLLLA